MDPTYRFHCQHCQSELEVPLAFAGVTGPCPTCGQEITAPPPPSAGHFEESALPAPVQHAPSYHPAPAPVYEPVPVAMDPRPQSLRSSSHQPVSARGPNLPKILGWGTLGLGALAAAATGGLFVFTKPPEAPSLLPAPAQGKDAEVQARVDLVERKKEAASIQALDTVRQFLARGAGEVPELLVSIADFQVKFDHPLFPDLDPGELVGRKITREIGSEDFWIEMVGPQQFPAFLLEQDNGTCRIHARALQEQIEGTLARFLADQSAAPYIGYFRTKPLEGDHPVQAVRQLQALSVIAAFPPVGSGPLGGAAVVEDHSPVAKRILERRNTATWGDYENAVLELHWSQTPQGEPYLKVASIIPCGWSRL